MYLKLICHVSSKLHSFSKGNSFFLKKKFFIEGFPRFYSQKVEADDS